MNPNNHTTPTNIMLDSETLGNRPGCKILTISAQTFGLSRNARFHAALRVDSQEKLHVDLDTWDWWQKQSMEARKAAFDSPSAISIINALVLFTKWIHEYAPLPMIWCKGANFDAPILSAAFTAYGLQTPWEFRNVRCYRTLLALVGHKVPPPAFLGMPHTSPADAAYQAAYAEDMLKYLGEKIG